MLTLAHRGQTVLGKHRVEVGERTRKDGKTQQYCRLIPRSNFVKVDSAPASVPMSRNTSGSSSRRSAAIPITNPETGQQINSVPASVPMSRNTSGTSSRRSAAIPIINPATGQQFRAASPPRVPEVLPDSDDDGKSEKSLSNFDQAAQASRIQSESIGGTSAPRSAPALDGCIVELDTTNFKMEALGTLRYLAKYTYWTFYDQEADPEEQDGEMGRGLFRLRSIDSNKSDGDDMMPACTWIIALNIDIFKPLLDPESSPMDKVLAIHTAAIVMLRGVISVVEEWKTREHGLRSVTYGDEFFADLPSSFENAFFGGVIGFPFHHDRTAAKRNGRAMILTGCDFPCAGDWARDYFPRLDKVDWRKLTDWDSDMPFGLKTRWSVYPIPGSWSVNMLKGSFWGHHVSERGLQALYFPKTFRALEQRVHDGFGSTHIESRTFPAEPPRVMLPHWESNSLCKALAARRAQWDRLREPWYYDAHLRWQVTPYSMPQTRWMMRCLRKWLTGRTPHDEFLADQLLNSLWLTREPSANGSPLAWFYAAVGHMFAACLPQREKESYFPSVRRTPAEKRGRYRLFRPVYRKMRRGELAEYKVNRAMGPTLKRRWFSVKRRAGGIDERVRHVRMARRMGEVYFATRPHDGTLKMAFMAALRHVEMQARNPALEDEWWECGFDLPPYTDNLGWINAEHDLTDKELKGDDKYVAVGEVQIRPGAFEQFAASVADAEKLGAPELPKRLLTTRADEVVLRMRQSTAPRRYWTWGEIADHCRLGSLWVLQKEGDGELAIMDISREYLHAMSCMTEMWAVADTPRQRQWPRRRCRWKTSAISSRRGDMGSMSRDVSEITLTWRTCARWATRLAIDQFPKSSITTA